MLEEMGSGSFEGPATTLTFLQGNPQAEEKEEERGEKESRSFHLYPMGLFFYLFANVQCNGLKPSRELPPPTQSCRGAELRQASHLPCVGHYPEPTPGQAAHHPRCPSATPHRLGTPRLPPPSTHTILLFLTLQHSVFSRGGTKRRQRWDEQGTYSCLIGTTSFQESAAAPPCLWTDH